MKNGYNTDRFISFSTYDPEIETCWDKFTSNCLFTFCSTNVDILTTSRSKNIFIAFLEKELEKYSAKLDYVNKIIEFEDQDNKALFILEWG